MCSAILAIDVPVSAGRMSLCVHIREANGAAVAYASLQVWLRFLGAVLCGCFAYFCCVTSQWQERQWQNFGDANAMKLTLSVLGIERCG